MFFFIVISITELIFFLPSGTCDHMTAIHSPAIFKSKMADETLRDGNERGLYNFKESLHTLLIGIQNYSKVSI